MQLYRGYKQKPVFWNSQLEQEYQSLQMEADQHAKYYQEHESSLRLKYGYEAGYIFQKMGNKLLRKAMLTRMISDQFFGDIRENAYAFAGQNGFVVELDVPDEVARSHYKGEQVMQGLIVGNYVFSGEELAGFEREGKISINDVKLEREKEPKEGDQSYNARRK